MIWNIKGKAAVKCLSNRHSKKFKKNPHDDTDLLRKIWKVLDSAEVVIAHNAQFDQGWINGRFLELGLAVTIKILLVLYLSKP